MKRSVAAAADAERVTRQTEAVLKSTGQVAGVSAGQVGKLADAISRKTGVDDEAIQSAENLLLTFTNVRNEAGKGNDVFSQATRTITDMSVALGQDMKSSSIQLGKALNDPVKGITALSRVGVSFTGQQKDQIKTLVASGKTMEAQKLILRELNKEFGGSAEAQAQPFDKLKVAVGNVEESIGAGLKPALDGIADDLTGFAQKNLPAVQRASDEVAAVFKRTDVGLGEKLKLSGAEVRENLGPTITALQAEFRDAKVGDKIGEAIEQGVPVIMDAAATAAPRAAGAFVNAFKNAGPWGQLITVAFLANKLGAFNAAGNAASGLFVRSMNKHLAEPLREAFRRNARSAGVAAATSGSTAAGTTIGPSMAKQHGKFGAAGRSAGGKFGKAFGLAAGALIAAEILKSMPSTAQYFGEGGLKELQKDVTGSGSDDFIKGMQKEADRRKGKIGKATPNPLQPGTLGQIQQRSGSSLTEQTMRAPRLAFDSDAAPREVTVNMNVPITTSYPDPNAIAVLVKRQLEQHVVKTLSKELRSGGRG